MFQSARSQGLQGLVARPIGPWLDEATLVCSARQGLWLCPVESGKEPRRLSGGPGLELRPSGGSANGGIVFSSVQRTVAAWSLDLANAEASGPRRLLPASKTQFRPTFDRGGEQLLYETQGPGSFQVRLRNLKTGVDISISDTPSDAHFPVFSPDGSRVAFQRFSREDRTAPIYVTALAEKDAIRVAENVGRLEDWSPDGKSLLAASSGLRTVDIATGETRPLVNGPRLGHARYSPDGGWVAFHQLSPDRDRSQVFVAPVHQPHPSPRESWIPITAETGFGGSPCWSADGVHLFYYSAQSGEGTLLLQRLDPSTRRPAGAPETLHTSEGPHRSIAVNLFAPTLSASRGKLAFSMTEMTGDVWISMPAPEDR